VLERAKLSILPNGNFREFFSLAGGILRFHNGNSRWPWTGSTVLANKIERWPRTVRPGLANEKERLNDVVTCLLVMFTFGITLVFHFNILFYFYFV